MFQPSIEFIEADQDVRDLLEQFVESGRTIFVVTDDDGDKIGAVYIEDIIKKVLED